MVSAGDGSNTRTRLVLLRDCLADLAADCTEVA